MRNFAWIIPLDRASALGKGGISPSYVLPKMHLSDSAKNLGNAHIWIIIRGSVDRCVAVVTPKRVECFVDGYYKGDFLITSDLSRSLRIAQNYENAKDVDFAGRFGTGIHELPDSAFEKLVSLIERSVQTKMLLPAIEQVSNVIFSSNSKRPEALVLAALTHITSNFSLDQIWGSGLGRKLKPIANFAQQVLRVNSIQVPDDLELLDANDPLNVFLRPSSEQQNKGVSTITGGAKFVDLDFTAIDPSKVYARTFVASNLLLQDLEIALEKTQHAEKLHQDMLRDISKYLTSVGAKPHESTSIDLMIEYQGRTKIFEIKTSSDSNAVSQSAKGAFQIACYVEAMEPLYQPLDSALILYRIENLALQEFVLKSLHRLGINCLIYDPLLDWPDRVRGLLS